MRKFAKVTVFTTSLLLVAVILSGCGSGGPEASDSTVAATVNGRTIMLKEVERGVTRQAGGKQAQLSQLELAQARLQILSNLIQREVMFQRAEREKLLPTEDQIDGKLGAAGIADGPHVEIGREHRTQDICHLGDLGCIAANQRHPAALPDLLAGSRDGRIEEM